MFYLEKKQKTMTWQIYDTAVHATSLLQASLCFYISTLLFKNQISWRSKYITF